MTAFNKGKHFCTLTGCLVWSKYGIEPGHNRPVKLEQEDNPLIACLFNCSFETRTETTVSNLSNGNSRRVYSRLEPVHEVVLHLERRCRDGVVFCGVKFSFTWPDFARGMTTTRRWTGTNGRSSASFSKTDLEREVYWTEMQMWM